MAITARMVIPTILTMLTTTRTIRFTRPIRATLMAHTFDPAQPMIRLTRRRQEPTHRPTLKEVFHPQIPALP